MDNSDSRSTLKKYLPKIDGLRQNSFCVEKYFNTVTVGVYKGRNTFRNWLIGLYKEDLNVLEKILAELDFNDQESILENLIFQVEDKKAQLVGSFIYNNKEYQSFNELQIAEPDPYDKEKRKETLIKAEPFVNVFNEELDNLVNKLGVLIDKVNDTCSVGHQNSFKTDKPHKTFPLKEEFKSEEKMKALHDGLVKDKFIESESVENYSMIFSGNSVKNTVIWAGGFNELKYFTDCINKTKFFGKRLSQPYAISAKCFIKNDYSEIKPSDISGANDPPAKKAIIYNLIAKMGT